MEQLEQTTINESVEPVIYCTECGQQLPAGTVFCTGCGFPVAQPPAKPASKTVKIAICAVLCVIAIILVICGGGILTGDDMQFYKDHLEQCEDGRRTCLSAMYQSSGYFRSTYQQLVNSYEDMIETDEEEIAKLNGQAISLFVVAGVCLAGAVVVVLEPWKKGRVYGTY